MERERCRERLDALVCACAVGARRPDLNETNWQALVMGRAVRLLKEIDEYIDSEFPVRRSW
jgi:hypothetical protein